MDRFQFTEALHRFREVLLASGLQCPTTQLMSYHLAKYVCQPKRHPLRWSKGNPPLGDMNTD